MSTHIGRSFDRHPLEDACPCPQEPCGLIAVSRIDPACDQHSLAAGKTIRQTHPAERCPVTAPTSSKPDFPPDLIETAARALWAHWNPSGPAWGRTSEAVREEAREETRAVLSVVAGPLRAEALREAANDHRPACAEGLRIRADRIEES